VTFLDFGLVKRWAPGELETLTPTLDAILRKDPEGTLAALQDAGFLPRKVPFEAEYVYRYVSAPYRPFMEDHFTYTRRWVAEMLGTMIDIQGDAGELIRASNMPPSYVILDRVFWGMSALFGRLHASGNWRALLAEYRKGVPPSTELGRIEEQWRLERQVAGAQ